MKKIPTYFFMSNSFSKHLNFIPKNHIIFKTNIQKTAFNKNKKIAKHVFLS